MRRRLIALTILQLCSLSTNNISQNCMLVSTKVVFEQVYSHLQNHKRLFENQFGFRKAHSTDLAALQLIDSIYEYLDNGKIHFAIFLDLSKAFDTIDHYILLHKLNHYGFRNSSLAWYKSYLTGRPQYVAIDMHKATDKMQVYTVCGRHYSDYYHLFFLK